MYYELRDSYKKTTNKQIEIFCLFILEDRFEHKVKKQKETYYCIQLLNMCA